MPESYTNVHPTLNNVLETLENYNQDNQRSPDTLDAIISDLATSIFQSQPTSQSKKYMSKAYTLICHLSYRIHCVSFVFF